VFEGETYEKSRTDIDIKSGVRKALAVEMKIDLIKLRKG
jgi:hypothetical protein